MSNNTVLVCRACGAPWVAPGSPAVCPKCKVASFAISIKAKNEGDGDTKMTKEESLRILASNYANRKDLEKLDALYQWATNRTSGTAIHKGKRPDHEPIKDNLKIRYGLTDEQAEEVYANFKADIESAGFEFHTGYLEAGEGIKEYFAQDSVLRDIVLGRLKTAPQDVQYIAWLFSKDKGDYFGIMRGREKLGNFAALLGAAFNIQITDLNQQVIEPLIKLGFLNEVDWTSASGKKEHRDFISPTFLRPIVADIDQTISLPALPDFKKYIDAVFEKGRVTVLVGLEELFNGSGQPQSECIVDASGMAGEIIPQPYLIGKYGSTLAINPRIRTNMGRYFFEKKLAVPKNQNSIQQAIGQLHEKYYPDMSFHPRDLFPGTFAWEMHTSDKALSQKDILIILTPWLTKNQIEGLRKEASSKFVAIVSTVMGIPELNDAFRKVYGTDNQGVDWVIIDTTRTPFVERAAAVKPRLLSELLNMLGLQQNAENEPAKAVQGKQEQGVKGKLEPQIEKMGPIGNLLPPPPPIAPSPQLSLDMSVRDRLLACFASDYAIKSPDESWLSNLASALESILDELGIACTVTTKEFQWGPRIVRANVQLSKGVLIKKVVNAALDIANKLFSRGDLFKFDSDDEVPKSIRIESVPAKGMVGIYIPRNDFTAVPIGQLLRSLPKDEPLSFPIGLNAIGKPQFSNLDSMPHLLIAGQPGAGKSVFLNCMIVSLALQNDSTQLQFVLIDPKGGLEFGPYERLPHVAQGQMVTSDEMAVEALSSARQEMDNRYTLMKESAKSGPPVRKLQEYNKLPGIKTLPYRVIMVDEFANLVLSKSYGRQIVELVQALAQKGRAAGFYMVICTQRPSVKAIPGDIKAVVPSRISFRVPASIDSKVILDEPGAEALLGKGDMFLKETTHPDLRRFQGPFVTNEEIDRFVKVTAEVWGK